MVWSLAVGAALAALAALTLKRDNDPARCPAGMDAVGARCCGSGQTLHGSHCSGDAKRCAVGMILVEHAGQRHCQWPARRVQVAAGTLDLSPIDWEAEGIVSPRRITVSTFALDDSEVTWGRYLACLAVAEACKAIALPLLDPVEPGLPITQVSPAQAGQLCAALGGRLPSGEEWLFAAAGVSARRFPWGATGLVCRRAAFGLAQGPCAWGGSLPELAGARPDGATETGLLDLAGNVAEWTTEPAGHAARGGSFRSNVAGQLKSWASTAATVPALDIGFRCAYDQH